MIRTRRKKPSPTERSRSRPSLWWVVAVVAAGALGGLVPRASHQLGQWLRGNEFVLRSVAVGGTQRLTATEVATASAVRSGVALLDIDPERVAAQLSAHPWIAGVELVRLWPNRLLIEVTEREPIAVTQTERGRFFVDRQGMAFAPAFGEPDALARLDLQPPPTPGAWDARLAACVALMEDLELRTLPAVERLGVKSATDSSGVFLRLAGVTGDIVLGQKDLERKLDRLETLLGAELPELAQARTIDFRFSQRAVLRKDVLLGTSVAGNRETRDPALRGPAG